MSVIGYDDTDYAEFFRPALTTIEQPVWDIAKSALDLVLQRIAQPDGERQVAAFDANLIVRESTAPFA